MALAVQSFTMPVRSVDESGSDNTALHEEKYGSPQDDRLHFQSWLIVFLLEHCRGLSRIFF